MVSSRINCSLAMTNWKCRQNRFGFQIHSEIHFFMSTEMQWKSPPALWESRARVGWLLKTQFKRNYWKPSPEKIWSNLNCDSSHIWLHHSFIFSFITDWNLQPDRYQCWHLRRFTLSLRQGTSMPAAWTTSCWTAKKEVWVYLQI